MDDASRFDKSFSLCFHPPCRHGDIQTPHTPLGAVNSPSKIFRRRSGGRKSALRYRSFPEDTAKSNLNFNLRVGRSRNRDYIHRSINGFDSTRRTSKKLEYHSVRARARIDLPQRLTKRYLGALNLRPSERESAGERTDDQASNDAYLREELAGDELRRKRFPPLFRHFKEAICRFFAAKRRRGKLAHDRPISGVSCRSASTSSENSFARMSFFHRALYRKSPLRP